MFGAIFQQFINGFGTTVKMFWNAFNVSFHKVPLKFTLVFEKCTHRHSPSLTVTHHHSPSLTITQHHTPSLTIDQHHSPSPTVTHRHSPSLNITHHHCLHTIYQYNSLHTSLKHTAHTPRVQVHSVLA